MWPIILSKQSNRGMARLKIIMLLIFAGANIFLTVASAVYANSGNNNSHAGLAAVVAVWLYSGADAVAGGQQSSFCAEVAFLTRCPPPPY